MSSGCFGLIEVECLLVFPLKFFFLLNICETQNQNQHRPVSLQAEGLPFSQGGFFLYLFGKVQSNRNYERQAGFFYFLFSIIHHKHFWQHWLTCEIFYFISWNLGHISRGTARPFVRFVFVSMVFSLHLITRSQKSTKMDEFELSGCTKLRYLHDWCCLALFSCFVLFILGFVFLIL